MASRNLVKNTCHNSQGNLKRIKLKTMSVNQAQIPASVLSETELSRGLALSMQNQYISS